MKNIINILDIYAPNPNHINQNWRTNQQNYIDTLLAELIEYLRNGGLKRLHLSKLRESLSCVIANSRQAALHGRQVLYSRTTSGGQNHIMQVVDWLAATNRIKNIIGRANSFQGASSWFEPVDSFAYELERAQITIALANGSSMVELHTINPKNPNTWLTTAPDRNSRMITQLSDPVRLYNRSWCAHGVLMLPQLTMWH